MAYMEDNERCTVTCRESGDGLKDTIFSSGGFTVEDGYLRVGVRIESAHTMCNQLRSGS
jgi:hypothetical protein